MDADPRRRNCPATFSVADTGVEQPAQHLEEPGQALGLVKYHQPVLVPTDMPGRIGLLLPVGKILQIQVQAAGPSYGSRDGRFADLAWPQQHDGSELTKVIFDDGL